MSTTINSSSSSDTIKLTLSVEQAREYARAYPHSKYIQPALDKLSWPEVPFKAKAEDVGRYPAGTVIYNPPMVGGYNRPRTKMYNGHSSKWMEGSTEVTQSTVESYVKNYTPDVIFVGTPASSSITIEIPVEEARKIGGCIIPPLVEAWDKEHVSPVEELLRVVKPGQIVYYEYSPGGARPDAFFKVDNTTFQRLPNNGDKTYVEDRALKALADIWSNVAPSNIKVI